MVQIHFDMANFSHIIDARKRLIDVTVKSLALKEAADFLKDRMEARIFGSGKRTDNKVIGTGAQYKHKDGTPGTQYSKQYAKRRTKEGLQVGFIDFQRTGELRRSIKVIRESDGNVVIGIADTANANKAYYLHKMKGITFEPTKAEVRGAGAILRRVLRERVMAHRQLNRG